MLEQKAPNASNAGLGELLVDNAMDERAGFAFVLSLPYLYLKHFRISAVQGSWLLNLGSAIE